MHYFLDRPRQIKISLTNVCNYRCVMCPNPKFKQQRAFITDRLVRKILNECRDLGVGRVALGSTGEPLMHRNFIEYLRYAKSLGLRVSTTTNCSLLSPAVSEALIRERIDRVSLSIYSSDEKSHLAYTGTNSFGKVAENITKFLELWHESGSATEVNMAFLSIPGVNDRERFMSFWGPLAKRIGLPITVKPAINWGGTINLYGSAVQGERLRVVKKPSGPELVIRHQIRCPHVCNYLFIIHDGTVYPCCNILESDGRPEVEFGNIGSETIRTVWNSGKYLAFKMDHFNKRIEQYPFCRRCSDVIRYRSVKLNPAYYAGKLASIVRDGFRSVRQK